MGKKSKPPPAPDYGAIANSQATASQDLASQQTAANRPDISTPWGSQTWQSSAGVDPSTGKPITNWSSNITLAPEQQAALDSQMRVQQGLSQGAEGLIGQAADNFSQPMDWSSLPSRSGQVQAGQVGQGGVYAGPLQNSIRQYQLQRGVGDPNAYRQQAQTAVEKLQQPGLDRRRSMVETQLANQGIPRNSEAWNAAMQEVGDEESRAGLQAIGAGRDEANQMFGQQLQAGQFGNQAQLGMFGMGAQAGAFGNSAQGQRFNQLMQSAQLGDQRAQQQLQMEMQAGAFNNTNRQQAISEEQLRRSQPINEINALLTGQQVQNPAMPQFSQAKAGETPQYLNAANMGYQASLDRYNGGQNGMAGLMGGLFGLGSAAMNNGGWGNLFSFGG